jgi:hypothetical protein
MKLGASVLLSLVLILGTAGCTTQDSASPAPTVTVTGAAAPSPSPSEVPAAEPRTAVSPLEAVDAYALCKAQTMINHPTAEVAKTLVYASFEDSVVVAGPQGRWFAQIPTVDQSRNVVAHSYTECVVGGTIGDPEWVVYGEGTEASEPYFDGGSD